MRPINVAINNLLIMYLIPTQLTKKRRKHYASSHNPQTPPTLFINL